MAGSIKGITIEIGGNTTKLSTALKEPISQTKYLQSALKDVNKALKFDSSNVDLLKNKQTLLTQTIESTENELKLLKEAQQQYIDSGGDLNAQEYVNLTTKIAVTEQQIKSLKEQQSNFSAEVESMGIKLGEFGEKATKAGTTLTKSVTTPIVALGTAAVTTAASFESSMSQVQATMGITSDATSELNGQTVNTMDSLESLAQTMGETTAFSASECADAINYLALAGYDTQQMYDTLPTVLNLAAAGSMDLATASDMVTDAMSALGMNTDEATTMVDQMAKTASSSNTSVSQLGEAILTIGGTAKTVAGGTTELNTALGILANNGIKGSEGGTHLRNVIMSLQSPTDTASAAMEELGLKVYDAEGNMRPLNDILGDLNTSMSKMTTEEKQNIISKIFNKTDIASVNALLANTGDTWDSLQATIADSAGSAQQMANTQLDNLQGQLTLLKSAVEALAISIGNVILPVVKNFVSGLQSLVDWLNGLSDGAKTAVVAVAAIAAAIGPALIAVGKMATGASQLIKFFNSGATAGGKLVAKFAAITGGSASAVIAIAGIVAAIGAVVAAFVNLWQNNEEFRTKITEIWNGIKETWQSFTDGITERLNALGFDFENFSQVVSAVWNGFCEILAPVFEGAFETISEIFTTVTNTILNIWDIFSALFQGDWDGVWEGVQSLFGDIWNGICSVFSTCIDTIKGIADTILGFFGTDWDTCFQTVSETWNNIWQGISDFFSPIAEGIQSFAQGVIDFFNGDWTSCWENISEGWNSIWQGISDFFSGIVEGIKSIAKPFLSWLGINFEETNDEIETDNADTWSTVQSDTATALSGIQSDSSEKWAGISTIVTDTLSDLKQSISDKWSEIKKNTSETWSNIKENISQKWSDIKSDIGDKITSVKENISEKWNSVKSNTSTTWENIKSGVSTKVGDVKSNLATKFQEIYSTISSKWSSAKSSTETSWSSMSSTTSTKVGSMQSNLTSGYASMATVVSNKMTAMASTMASQFAAIVTTTSNSTNSIGNQISSVFSGAVSTVKNAVSSMRSAMNFSWSLPKLALPHISISGKFSLNPPSAPSFSISWYRKAMEFGQILTNPTIFGMMNGSLLGAGEAGPEAIVGVSSLDSMIQKSVANSLIRVLANCQQPQSADASTGDGIDYDKLASAVGSELSKVQWQVNNYMDSRQIAKAVVKPLNQELAKEDARR
jgi:TP901 family phage tail tape measure protein